MVSPTGSARTGCVISCATQAVFRSGLDTRVESLFFSDASDECASRADRASSAARSTELHNVVTLWWNWSAFSMLIGS